MTDLIYCMTILSHCTAILIHCKTVLSPHAVRAGGGAQTKTPRQIDGVFVEEVESGFEPLYELLQSSA